MESFVKNPVYRNEYTNDSGFRLLEAIENWIVFRAVVSSYIIPGESEPRPTVDIMFLGAIYIELPTHIKGLKVTKPKDNLSKNYAEKYDKGFNFDERVYAIESNGNRYHVVASNLWIHVHKKRISELPIKHFISQDLDSYNNYLSKYVQDWIKIK